MLGIDQYDFLHKMTFADYQIKAYYYHKLQEQKEKAEWERQRYFSVYLISPHLGKTSVKSMSDIIPLPWEIEERKPKKLTKKQLEKRKAETDSIMASHKRFWELKAKSAK